MDTSLRVEHGLTLNDYEVLLTLSQAEDRRLRRVDLAERVLLTQSGITRLLHGLEEGGYVERAACDSDRRVTYAQLTEAGLRKLRAAARTHVRDIEELFAGRMSAKELESLDDLLARFSGGEAGESCGEGA